MNSLSEFNFATAGVQIGESAIASVLEDIKDVLQPVNTGIDIDILIPSSGWSNSSPYQYTYSNEHITSGSMVKVNFLEGDGNSTPLYLEYEKVTNGVRFEAPSKPTNDISVRVHIFSADTTSTVATTADEVSTEAVSGANNVKDALSTLNDQIANYTKVASANNVSFTNRQASLNVSTLAEENVKRVVAVYAMGQAYGFTWWVTNGTTSAYSIGVYCVNDSGISSVTSLKILYIPN